ncbi:MAG: DUF58 domain-containing protein [Pseudomonadota bacterium]
MAQPAASEFKLARGQVGAATPAATAKQLIGRSRARAALVPDLLVEARRVANTVISGWHGRRRRGVGENFWQFRPFADGENPARIDWRRSARDENLYLRDREWEAVHTVWLWADGSPSMRYQSGGAQTSKQERALVLALAMAEVLARSGERIGYLGAGAPITHRQAAERLAAKLPRVDTIHFEQPDVSSLRPHSDVVIVSDFLGPLDKTLHLIDELASRRVRGHLVHIIDPAEERFPFTGRTDFIDPERGVKLTAGRAESMSEEYRKRFTARQEALHQAAVRRGWSYIRHHTDKPASQVLVALHLRMSDAALGAA